MKYNQVRVFILFFLMFSIPAGAQVRGLYPNVGMEGEFKVGRNMSIMARPDLTITPGKNLFVAVVGATFLGF